jgi:hypothetical protein
LDTSGRKPPARGDSAAGAAHNIDLLDALKLKYDERLLPLALDVGNKAAVEQGHKSSAHANDRHLLAKNSRTHRSG